MARGAAWRGVAGCGAASRGRSAPRSRSARRGTAAAAASAAARSGSISRGTLARHLQAELHQPVARGQALHHARRDDVLPARRVPHRAQRGASPPPPESRPSLEKPPFLDNIRAAGEGAARTRPAVRRCPAGRPYGRAAALPASLSWQATGENVTTGLRRWRPIARMPWNNSGGPSPWGNPRPRRAVGRRRRRPVAAAARGGPVAAAAGAPTSMT